MYRHTSKTLKVIANVLAILGILASVILGILILRADGVRLMGRTLLPARACMPAGLAVIILGAFLSWVAGLLVQALGELLQKTKDNNYLLSRIAAHTKDIHDRNTD